MAKKRFKVETPEGYISYQYKFRCADADFDQWREMIAWAVQTYGEEWQRWAWAWPNFLFRDEQDLLWFQLKWIDYGNS